MILSRIVKGGKFAVELLQNDNNNQKCLFPTKFSFFAKTNAKFFKFGKIRKFAEEYVSEKKRFYFSKKHSILCKSWMAEIIPVVAGHLVPHPVDSFLILPRISAGIL